MSEDLKGRVLAMFQKKSSGDKKMYYIRDVTRWLPEDDRTAIQNVVRELLDEGVLCYWSSGSSTYLILAEYFPKEEGAT